MTAEIALASLHPLRPYATHRVNQVYDQEWSDFQTPQAFLVVATLNI